MAEQAPGAPGGDELWLWDEADLRHALEAVLLVVDEPAPTARLAAALGAPLEQVAAALAALAAAWRTERRGFVLREVAGGWRLYSDPAAATWVERFLLEGRSSRLSQAALETLAIVAYEQPVTRARISEIRGVDADAAVRSLVSRGLLAEVGRDPSPGQPVLYGTTPALLEQLDLDSLDDLPALPTLDLPGPLPPEPPPGGYREARRQLSARHEPRTPTVTSEDEP